MEKTTNKITKKDLDRVFWRMQVLNVTNNFESMQAIGFLSSFVPVLERLYKDRPKEEKVEAMKRHLKFFNSHVNSDALILGVAAAIEESTNEDEKDVVTSVKTGLMGPLAGIGDSVLKFTWLPICGSIGAALALNGSVLGPILMFLLYNIVNVATKYYGIHLGYKKGMDLVNEVGAVLKNGVTHYLPEYEIYGTTVEKELFSAGHKQYVHVYYNGVQAEKEKIQFNSQLGKIENTLSKKIEEKIQRREDVKTYETYYRMKFDDNGYFLNYQRKDKNIKETVDRMGYFVIVTSKKMNAEQALNIYRDRDAVEKVFRMEKSYLGCDVFRVHTTDKLESKMFVSFIALIIRNEISKKTKKLYQSNRSEYTIQKIVQQLDLM